MKLTDVTFDVYRVEARMDADSVDFWDFPNLDTARVYMRTVESEYPPASVTVRKLNPGEIIQTALAVYKDIINLPPNEK